MSRRKLGWIIGLAAIVLIANGPEAIASADSLLGALFGALIGSLVAGTIIYYLGHYLRRGVATAHNKAVASPE